MVGEVPDRWAESENYDCVSALLRYVALRAGARDAGRWDGTECQGRAGLVPESTRQGIAFACNDVRVCDGIANESVPIQLAQCWFHGLAISYAKILIYFSTKIHGSNFIKQRCYGLKLPKPADCSLRKKIIVSFIIIFGTFSFPMAAWSASILGSRCKFTPP